jgi:hypothetical protein
MVNMHGCEMLITAFEVHSGMHAGITRRRVRTFPHNSIVGAFSSMGVGKVVVVSADGSGDLLAFFPGGLCLDAIGVGDWKGLRISHFRWKMCGRNDGQNTYPSHHADGIESANLEGPTG